MITLWDEKLHDAQPLLVPIILKGELVYDFPETQRIRHYALEQLAALPEEYKKLTGSKVYPVTISEALNKVREELFEQYRAEYLS